MDAFTETERIANSMSLTRNPASSNDEESLTPYHFLNIRPTTNMPGEEFSKRDKFRIKKWRQAQLLSHNYQECWLCEYIPSLQQRQKWQQAVRDLKIGDLVLVADDMCGDTIGQLEGF